MTAWYVDTHCHLGAYSDPASIANAARRTVVIAMTESPGDYIRVRRLLGHLRTVRVALGLHPLRPPRPDDYAGFTAVLPEVEYVGEVGIDRSSHSEVPEAGTSPWAWVNSPWALIAGGGYPPPARLALARR